VIGLVQVGAQALADRYVYLSFIGVFVAVVWALAEGAQKWRIPAFWLAILSVVILATLGFITHRQITYWRNSETLWKHTLGVTEGNYTAHDALAHDLAEQGRVQEADVEFDAAYRLHAYSAAELIDIGHYLQYEGYTKDSIVQYAHALDSAGDAKTRVIALIMLGSAFTKTGDFADAKKSYSYALREDHENNVALVSSGLLAERDGNYGAAVDQIAHAMKVTPSDVGYLLLAQALRRGGHLSEADEAAAHAQRISYDFPKAQKTAAQVLAATGIETEATR
jgi:Tfp pilus assembly protein PilF